MSAGARAALCWLGVQNWSVEMAPLIEVLELTTNWSVEMAPKANDCVPTKLVPDSGIVLGGRPERDPVDLRRNSWHEQNLLTWGIDQKGAYVRASARVVG
jgi:hypothetical protein